LDENRRYLRRARNRSNFERLERVFLFDTVHIARPDRSLLLSGAAPPLNAQKRNYCDPYALVPTGAPLTMIILEEACQVLAAHAECSAPLCAVAYRFGILDAAATSLYAIAIPARNEQSRIIPCLQACLTSMLSYGSFGVVVLAVNNTSDQTTIVAADWASQAGLPLEIISVEFPEPLAFAGAARRLAMDRARASLPPRGVLLTTDADSIPDRTWVSGNLHELADRSVLVCGSISFDEQEAAHLPPGTLETGTSETLYKLAARELVSLLDPDPVNPWPHHGQVSGASLAMRASAYDRIGGSPIVTCGEDRALAQACRENDIPVAYSSRASVITSCRLIGRAPGGMADTIAQRMTQDDFLCDEELEAPEQIWARAKLRAELRTAILDRRSLEHFIGRMRLSERARKRVLSVSRFGALWCLLETASPLLARQRISRRALEVATPRLLELLKRAKAGRKSLAPALL
jgi:hypothetical protein